MKNNSYTLSKAKSGRANVWLHGSFNFSSPTNAIEHYFEMIEDAKEAFKKKVLIDVHALASGSQLLGDD